MRTSTLLALSLLAAMPVPTMAQLPAPEPALQEQQGVREKFWLSHQKSNFIMRLLLDGKRINFDRSLVPVGIMGISTPLETDCMVLEGTPSALEALKRGLLVADVEMVSPNKQRSIVIVTPKRLKPQELSERALKLPGAGVTQVRGEQVAIDGNPVWVREVLRIVIRAEIAEP